MKHWKKWRSVSQLYDMKPLGSGHKFIREQVERARAIVKSGWTGECCVFYNVFCPLSFSVFRRAGKQ